MLQDAAATAAAACSPGDNCPICAQTIPPGFEFAAHRHPPIAPRSPTRGRRRRADARTSRTRLAAANRAADQADGKLTAARGGLARRPTSPSTMPKPTARDTDVDITKVDESDASSRSWRRPPTLDEQLAAARAAEQGAEHELDVATATMADRRQAT